MLPLGNTIILSLTLNPLNHFINVPRYQMVLNVTDQ